MDLKPNNMIPKSHNLIQIQTNAAYIFQRAFLIKGVKKNFVF